MLVNLWNYFREKMGTDSSMAGIRDAVKEVDALLQNEQITEKSVTSDIRVARNVSNFATRLFGWMTDEEREYLEKNQKKPIYFLRLVDLADACVLKQIVENSDERSRRRATEMVNFVYKVSRSRPVSVSVDFGIGCAESDVEAGTSKEEIRDMLWNDFCAANEKNGICTVLSAGARKSYLFHVKEGTWQECLSAGACA
jgi:hypothetical protein